MKTDNNSYPHILAAGMIAYDKTISNSLAARIVQAFMDNAGTEFQLFPKDIAGLLKNVHQTTAGKEAKNLARHGILKSAQTPDKRTKYWLNDVFKNLHSDIRLSKFSDSFCLKPEENVDWRDANHRQYARRVDPVVFEHKDLFLTMDEMLDFYEKVSSLLFFTPLKSFIEVSYKVKGREMTIPELNEALDEIEKLEITKDFVGKVKSNLAKFVP